MIDTSRISSGFDVELQLGGGWFATAIVALHEEGLLLPDPLPAPIPPDAEIEITAVEVVPGDEFDLEITVAVNEFPFPIRAALALGGDGSELVVTTDQEDVEFTVPFDVFDDLAGPPVLQKVAGADGHDPAIAVLANLDLRASDQSDPPLPEGEHLARGDPTLAESFLPVGQDLALGVGAATFPRLANNVWHTQLRAADGTHPLPDESDPQGQWSTVTVTPLADRIRLQLDGDVKADSPLIDVVPDPHVTVTLDLIPGLDEGNVVFEVDVDANVDTGLLGDLFAFVVGGIVGFVLGILGGPLVAGALAGAFAVASVIALEVTEAVAEGEVARQVRAEVDGETLPPILTCQDGVVTEAAVVLDSDAVSLGPLSAIPRSVPVFSDEPEPLYERTLLVTAAYDDLTVDAGGLGITGPVASEERFVPKPAELTGRVYDGDDLLSLTYGLSDGTEVEVPIDEVLARLNEAEIVAPFDVRPEPDDAVFRHPEGKLPTVCLHADAIRREDTVVTEIQFDTGVDLHVQDAVQLQDAGGLLVRHLQLIHPSNANPYFRSFADGSLENNFENKPTF